MWHNKVSNGRILHPLQPKWLPKDFCAKCRGKGERETGAISQWKPEKKAAILFAFLLLFSFIWFFILSDKNPKLVRKWKGHEVDVSSVSFSPDGKILASGSWDNTIKLWRVSDGKLVWEWRAPGITLYKLAYKLAKKVDLFLRPHFGISVSELLRYPPFPLSVSFSPDGQFLVAGMEDGRIYLWRVQFR